MVVTEEDEHADNVPMQINARISCFFIITPIIIGNKLRFDYPTFVLLLTFKKGSVK